MLLYFPMFFCLSVISPVNVMQRPFTSAIKTLFFSLFLIILSSSVFGSDINLSLQQKSEGNRVTVIVRNKSASAATLTAIAIELDHRKYGAPGFPVLIGPGEEKNITFTVNYPSVPGSYSLIVRLRYLNDGTQLSLNYADLYHYQRKAVLPESCTAGETVITQNGEIVIRSSNPSIWKLVLPDEVSTQGESVYPNRKIISIRNTLKGFNNNYPYFAVADEVQQGIHYAALCSGMLRIRTGSPADETGNGRISEWVLLLAIIVFLTAFVVAGKMKQRDGKFANEILKYTSRLFLITICYLLLKIIDDLLSQGGALSSVAAGYDVYKRSNFSYFFHYFVDIYWTANLVLVFPFLYFFDAHRTAEQDKYANLVKSLVSLAPSSGPFHWNKDARLGMLTVLVKFFYIPLLVTWVINNTMYQSHLTHTFHWELVTVNAYLVALFIYVDTAIYCFGYLFEFDFLNNKIKSVEPTLLGWIVCLWCYPPFNFISFRIFDFEFIRIAHRYPGWVNAVMLCLITALWGIFVWASLSLGWKASNLTNRGIVRHGPYRFVRHPAYTAKLFLWCIQGIIFGQYFLGILLGFALIYFLRAWTEERHLSLDPDYLEYRKAVKWRFIPGLI
jgi:protein-S-isoprenylcysteine O-methyltransferase Ste14